MLICGIDEAGRGCLAGSLFVAGVVCDEKVLNQNLSKDLQKMGIKDSKKLSKLKRYELKSRLDKISHLSHFVVEKTAEEIDTKGLSACLKEALEAIMQAVVSVAKNEVIKKPNDRDDRADEELGKSSGGDLLDLPQEDLIRFYFDGNSTFGASTLSVGRDFATKISLECIVKGDALVPLISCASIYAKCAKDTQSVELDKIYPQYDLATNAGYGTKAHIESIARYGLSPIHRASFCGKFLDYARSLDSTLFGECVDSGDFVKSSVQKSSRTKTSEVKSSKLKSNSTDSKNTKSSKPKSTKRTTKATKNQPSLF